MTGHICPECGTDGRPGTGPGCACAGRAAHGDAGQPQHTEGRRPAAPHEVPAEERAAEQRRIAEQHAERSAEMAAAEDFDPLRIRPYVTLGGERPAATAPGGPQEGPQDRQQDEPRGGSHDTSRAPAPDGRPGDAATTMPLFLNPAGPAPGPGPGPGPLPDAVAPTGPGDPGGPADGTHTALPTAAPAPVQPRRRRPFAALAAGAAVVTVVGTAAFIGGLFNGDGGGEADLDQALPSTVASLPEESASASASAKTSASPTPSRPVTASPSASTSASASPPPSASASRSASASASAPASPSPSATTQESRPPEGVAPPAGTPDSSTLRRGDHGPEVAELQRRLQEIWLYRGPADADYSDRVESAVRDFQSSMYIQGDPEGAYGPNTRRALEAITTGQGRH
ncbi:peptidoglycan-binding domain-containing protein [Streptomyces sp. ITFR-16]|uniref:peptidoglycan-binding domain-containing protein n=1 Tax=Streptomyces sp. ITFR-16 TaxID=3075198 RepID=UPI00288A59FD|nr:peptidoglycan-binding domain-containing protein [Streptomyces sp. ITFR-16]WNI24993.1 peptidoglycan-binding domain-containing protein [Streptomyces sp. ITFR-16]